MSASALAEGRVAGRYFDGQSSQARAAEARVEAEQLEVHLEGGERLRFAADQVRLGTQVGSAGCYLHLGEGAALESTDVAGVQALVRALRSSTAGTLWLHRLEVSPRLIVLSLLVTVALMVGGVVWGVPWASDRIASMLPESLEELAGSEALDAIDRTWADPSELTEARQQALLAHMQPSLQWLTAQYPERTLKVHFRSAPALGANAFALPGGHLVFTDAMVELAQHDDELVAVLAHEAGHAVHRHGMRNLVQGSLLVFVMASMTGDMSAASDLVTGVPALLATLAYRRGMEEEADDFALDMLRARHISPSRFVDIMQRLDPPGEGDETGSVGRFLSTHPPTPERIERFQEAE